MQVCHSHSYQGNSITTQCRWNEAKNGMGSCCENGLHAAKGPCGEHCKDWLGLALLNFALLYLADWVYLPIKRSGLPTGPKASFFEACLGHSQKGFDRSSPFATPSHFSKTSHSTSPCTSMFPRGTLQTCYSRPPKSKSTNSNLPRGFTDKSNSFILFPHFYRVLLCLHPPSIAQTPRQRVPPIPQDQPKPFT
jgi:hypothetical protein